MLNATVKKDGDHSTIHLPPEYHLPEGEVSVRRAGDAIILEPVKPSAWPTGFFKSIAISDPSFERPPQPPTPPIKDLEDRD
jgi:antitoxin VapB